jgi:hypothetical protein
VQTYACHACKRRWSATRRKHFDKDIWFSFVFHKQTIRELKEETGHDKKTILEYLENFEIEKKVHRPRSINLVVDATYFGKRMDNTSWGVILFRDAKEKENLWWKYIDTERESYYREGKDFLLSLGYTILSVTCDGFSGNIPVFKGFLLQMCHFHTRQIVTRNVTTKPQTETGQVVLALSKTLTYTDEETFAFRIREFYSKYYSFLNEKTHHPEGGWSYTHDGVRRAYNSLVYWFPYLFNYKKVPGTPNTTNTCDGHFSHIKDVVRIHRGLHKTLKQKMLDSIFLESTIAPKQPSKKKKNTD